MKGSRADLSSSPCGIARALHVVGDWWSLLIVRDVLAGKTRFSEIQNNLGCAKNILSARLKKLIEDGVLDARPDGSGTRHHYQLTKKGRDLHVALAALWQWGAEHCTDHGRIRRVLADRSTGLPLDTVAVFTTDGTAFSQTGFEVIAKPSSAKRATN